ncbi:MAG: enoyl-CoA hydratase/isomerase family protein [Tatlockia sp.]|nr:enoyl-CoA hydratase/isomerase family protein [Tatlockia sp.]
MTSDIVFSREQHIGLVTLTRPQALNALNLSMIKALQQQLELWQKDDAIHAVVVQAEEGKAFCAGGDVRWLYEAGLAEDPEQMQFFWHEYRLNHYIHQFKKPYIALMDGITMGGGVGISLHGSHPVATERFVFAMPETGIGFFPDIGASYLLARCPSATGLYLGLSGNRLNAHEALSLGLIKKVINSEQLPQLLTTLVNTNLAADAHHRVSACLQNLASPLEKSAIEDGLASINSCFAKDKVEAIFQALDLRADEWSLSLKRTLEQKAPLSLKVTLAQIQKAKTLSLADCLKMDYRLVNHFMQDSDFYEGIRALLVDKDKSPKWQPESLSLIDDAKVQRYFEKMTDDLELVDI